MTTTLIKTEMRPLANQQQLQQACKILSDSFLSLNQIWKKFQPRYEDVYASFYFKMSVSMKSQFAYAFFADGQMVGVCGNMELHDYLALQIPPTCKLFEVLGKYGSEVEQVLQKSGYKKGEAMYGNFAAMKVGHGSKGYALEFWLSGFHIMKQRGFKAYFSRMSSPISLFVLKKIGAKQISSINIKQEGLEDEKLTLIELDLDNLPNLQQFKKILRSKL